MASAGPESHRDSDQVTTGASVPAGGVPGRARGTVALLAYMGRGEGVYGQDGPRRITPVRSCGEGVLKRPADCLG